MHLVIYGDFNCPFSALASVRAEHLERTGAATVDWRAVEHDLDIPASGEPVRDALADEADRELEQVRGLVRTGEHLGLRRPVVRSNTGTAVATYSGVTPSQRPAVRAELFRRYWEGGQDLGDAQVLAEVTTAALDSGTAATWRSEWVGLERPIVPMMRLPDGYVSRGLGALSRLAELLDRTVDAS